MRYYKIKCGDWGYVVNPDFTLLNNELLTPREAEKFKIPKIYLEEVNLSRSKVYTIFGMRKAVE